MINLSIKTKMLIIFAVLAAIIAMGSINNFVVVRDSTEAANHVAVEFEEEVLVVNGVQDQLFHFSDSFHDYLISKGDGDKNKLLKQMEIFDRKLDSAQKGHFALKSERKMLRGAWVEWNKAKRLIVSEIIRSENDERFSVKMNEAVDDHIQKVNGRLDGLSEGVNLEMLELHERTRDKERRAFYLTSIFAVLGLAVIISMSALTYRSIITPLLSLKEAAGKISNSDFSQRVPIKNSDEIGAVSAAFNDMASSVEKANRKLEIESSHDGLTEALNRRYFIVKLREEISRFDRHRHPFSLLLFDVDKLKHINDEFGHQSGDKVLRHVAATVSKLLRPTDNLARFGGDEFAVILSETDSEEAMVTAKRIKNSILQNKVNLGQNDSLVISISIGVSNFPADASTEDEIFSAADKALYEAKKAGGNRARRFKRAA